jgi:hypothetical protein
LYLLAGAIEGDNTNPSGAVVAGVKLAVTEVVTGRAIPPAGNPEEFDGRQTGVC